MQKATLDGSTYEIPIEDFEANMNTESSKDKKERILDLFRNHNELKSEKEYINIRLQLLCACKEGDLELIKILLGETIEDDSKNFLFKIDKTNKTASFYGPNKKSHDLIIPRTVKHENDDYLVTSICCLHGDAIFCYSLNVKFEEESAVSTIYARVFEYSDIEEIYFPKSLIELKEGWCSKTEKLRRIIISPSNDQFIFKEDKYLIGKNNENDTEFDKLLFVRRDIEEISIPPSVTKICEYAFSNCKKIRKVEIPINSNLQTIEKDAFYFSNIEEIYFPKSLIELKEGWCSKTEKLRRIIISPSNGQFIFKEDKYLIGKSNENDTEFDKLLFVRRDIEEISIPPNIKIIGSCSFEYSNIKEIFIPPSVTKICEHAFYYCFNLRKIEIPTNSNLQTIENDAFSYSNIKEISIPQSVTQICEHAFADCFNLRKVEIPTNSNLQTIEKDAFLYSNILEISIPQNVTKICKGAFSHCENLRKVEIPTISNLQTIEKYAFTFSQIEEIFIPNSLIELKEGWCCGTEKLRRIIISPSNGQFIFKEDKYLIGKSNENDTEFDKLLFVRRDIEEISIPPSVTKICEYAFSNCKKIRKVEIPTNSNLQTIEKDAFSSSNIKEIFIPQSVTKICKDAFSCCYKLQIIEISEESQLQSISKSSFTQFEKLMIPSSLKELIKLID